MTRGTTPTHIFKLPMDTQVIKAARIVYCQSGSSVVCLTEQDVHMEGSVIRATLTQEQTLKFAKSQAVQVQLKILTVDGTALASKVKTISVDDCLCEEILT